MARFYALLANGGKLVTPHVVDGRRAARQNGRASASAGSAEPPRAVGVDAGALQVVKDGLYEATHASIGTSSACSAFPVSIAGKTGTAEKVVQPPGYRAATRKTSRGGAATGRRAGERPIVVCAMIENGGHGGVAAAPAALRVFEQYFRKQANRIHEPHQRLMAIEAVDTRARGLRTGAVGHDRDRRLVRRLDWL